MKRHLQKMLTKFTGIAIMLVSEKILLCSLTNEKGDQGVARHKKSDPVNSQEENPQEEVANAFHLQFQDEVIEVTSTTEYPIQVLQTEEYKNWINRVSDLVTKARITSNVDKMRRGLLGDWKEIDAGVFELRIDFGPGYRVYYARHEKIVVILLGGGVKNRQQRDIEAAKRLWKELQDEIKQV